MMIERIKMAEDEIVDAVKTTWQTLLNLNVDQVPAGNTQVDVSSSGSIQLTGDDQFQLLMEFDEGMAQFAARTFFGENPSADDIEDAISEIVNIIGGNVLGLIGTAPDLGLPEVPPGEDPSATPDTALRLVFKRDDMAVRLELRATSTEQDSKED